MNRKLIAIVDYGVGNIHSVMRATKHVCSTTHDVVLTADSKILASADKVIFPGQGAAGVCMSAINSIPKLSQNLREAIATRPFLGICMGMQVLFEHSEENQGTPCLGIVAGSVHNFAPTTSLKIPHMGWNTISQVNHPLWQGIKDNSYFYFVHSYYSVPTDKQQVVGKTHYDIPFASAIAFDQCFAIQAHPEKSADVGLQLLKNFINWKC